PSDLRYLLGATRDLRIPRCLRAGFRLHLLALGGSRVRAIGADQELRVVLEHAQALGLAQGLRAPHERNETERRPPCFPERRPRVRSPGALRSPHWKQSSVSSLSVDAARTHATAPSVLRLPTHLFLILSRKASLVACTSASTSFASAPPSRSWSSSRAVRSRICSHSAYVAGRPHPRNDRDANRSAPQRGRRAVRETRAALDDRCGRAK